MATNVTLHRATSPGSFEEMHVKTHIDLVEGLAAYVPDNLDDLTDVSADSPSVGNALIWVGDPTFKWMPGTVSQYSPYNSGDGTQFLSDDGSYAVPDYSVPDVAHISLPTSNGTDGHFLKHDGSFGLPGYTTQYSPPTNAGATWFLRGDGVYALPAYISNTNTWKLNTKLSEGYVPAGTSGTAGQVWGLDGTANPTWINKTNYSVETGEGSSKFLDGEGNYNVPDYIEDTWRPAGAYSRSTTDLANAVVFDDLTVVAGLVTGVGTRTLTLANLGYTGSATATDTAAPYYTSAIGYASSSNAGLIKISVSGDVVNIITS